MIKKIYNLSLYVQIRIITYRESSIMIKKIIYILSVIVFALFAQVSVAQELIKINSLNFDTSNSLLFIGAQDTVSSSSENIKFVKLENPKRIYFDIDSAILTCQSQNWFLNSNIVKQVRVSQFSTNPNIVRVVLNLVENYNPANISFYKINNNIVVKLKNDIICKENYFQTVYKEDRVSSSEYYENLSISNEEIANVHSAAKSAANDDMMSQIQQSFNKTSTTEKKEAIIKDLRLKSKYYVNAVTARQTGFLISGFGSLSVEKPLVLASPSRVVFDIPNAIVNPVLKNKEIKVGEETVKVAQYNQNKARVVISTQDTLNYIPIFSSDGQSVLFTKESKVDSLSLFDRTNDILSCNVFKKTSTSHDFILTFNAPVVFSIKRTPTLLSVYLYNTLRFNEKNMLTSVADSAFNELKPVLLPKVGLKLNIPLDRTSVAYCALGADGKALKISLKGNFQASQQNKSVITLNPKSPFGQSKKIKGNKTVVIDAGHGGTDYGAIREGVNEKDINLDVAKKVSTILKKNGVNVYMTRDTVTFISLQNRVSVSESYSPDLFVSIHVNARTKPEITGIETHYYNENSLELANTIHAKLVSQINSKDRGVFRSKFYVINHATVPAVLLEIGFISNSEEREALVGEDRKQKTAKAVAEGIIKYLKEK